MNQPFDHPEREITEPTRLNIFDELTLRGMAPSGRLDEVEFFQRVFNLTDMPTTDYRTAQFPDMAADLRQHRVRNTDWDDDWWVRDSRLDLLHVPDETFLRFLAAMVHPVVRPDATERGAYLEVFNTRLAAEGWEIGVVSHVGAHPIYGGRRLEQMPPAVADETKVLAQTLGDYVGQQVTRMEAALPGDPDSAIGTAKDFIETICKTILKARGVGIREDDLPALVRQAVNTLPLVPSPDHAPGDPIHVETQEPPYGKKTQCSQAF